MPAFVFFCTFTHEHHKEEWSFESLEPARIEHVCFQVGRSWAQPPAIDFSTMTTINKDGRGILLLFILSVDSYKTSLIFLKPYSMIKRLAMLLVFSLAYPVHALAEDASDTFVVSGFAPGMAQNSFDSQFAYPPPNHDQVALPVAAHDYGSHQNGRSFGQPLVVVPMPLPNNSMPGFSSTYGLQYPGSYMPRDTPLHRFNGYVTCDPPDLPKEAPAGTVSGTAAQRLIKITSTRSLAAPAQSQPCPVYTINGEIPKQKSYNTTTTMPSQRPAPPQITR